MEYKVLATVLQQHKKSAPDMVGKCCWLMENKPNWKGDWYKWEHEEKYTSNKFRLEELLRDGVHGIYCVKRLTDNVEFMIGDMINNYGKIEKIKIDSNGLFRAVFSRNRGVWRPLDEIPKNFHKDHQLIKNIEPYQILTVSLRDNTLITYDGERCISRTDKCPIHATKCLSEILKASNVKINSIFVDKINEVLTVGNKVNTNTGVKVITGFELAPEFNSLRIRFEDNLGLLVKYIKRDNFSLYQPTESYRMEIMDFSLKKYGKTNLDKMAEVMAGYSAGKTLFNPCAEIPLNGPDMIGRDGQVFELNLEQDWDAMREKMSKMFTDLDGNSNVEWINKKLLLLC